MKWFQEMFREISSFFFLRSKQITIIVANYSSNCSILFNSFFFFFFLLINYRAQLKIFKMIRFRTSKKKLPKQFQLLHIPLRFNVFREWNEKSNQWYVNWIETKDPMNLRILFWKEEGRNCFCYRCHCLT